MNVSTQLDNLQSDVLGIFEKYLLLDPLPPTAFTEISAVCQKRYDLVNAGVPWGGFIDTTNSLMEKALDKYSHRSPEHDKYISVILNGISSALYEIRKKQGHR